VGDEGGFLAVIRANRGDHAARLVYADWLDERGRSEGTFLRVECQLAGIDRASGEWVAFFERLRAASISLDPGWVALVSRVPVEQLRSPIPGAVVAAAWEHVSGLPRVKGYSWQLAEGRRVPAGWYFDYSARRVRRRRGPGTGFG
jgi:uncharacterized protein (TIGR02996 family)